MTLKAMIATLALLPNFTGIIPVAHAETTDSTQTAAAPNIVDFGSSSNGVDYPDSGCSGQASTPSAAARQTSLPEPETLMLCGLGLLLFGLRRRRK